MSGISGVNFAPGFDRSCTNGVALLAGAAVRHVEHRKPLVFGRAERVEPLRVLRIAEHQLVRRLRRAEPMVIDLVILVDRRQLLALLRRQDSGCSRTRCRAAARDLDPLRDRPSACSVATSMTRYSCQSDPLRDTHRHQLPVARRRERRQPHGAVFGPLVGIDEHLGVPFNPRWM